MTMCSYKDTLLVLVKKKCNELDMTKEIGARVRIHT